MAFLIEEPSTNHVGNALFDAFFDVGKEEDFLFGNDLFYGLDEDALMTTECEQPAKITKKRKSLTLEPKPFESKTLEFMQPEPVKAAPLKRKRGRPRKSSVERRAQILPSFDLEPMFYKNENDSTKIPSSTASLADVFLDITDVKPVSKELLKSRKSEDWDSKPTKPKRRLKWSEEELRKLWEGIATHGNNWREIRTLFSSRSYCQIKDKGRRCLFLLGWETGRSKVETESSNIEAKKLAQGVLDRMTRR